MMLMTTGKILNILQCWVTRHSPVSPLWEKLINYSPNVHSNMCINLSYNSRTGQSLILPYIIALLYPVIIISNIYTHHLLVFVAILTSFYLTYKLQISSTFNMNIPRGKSSIASPVMKVEVKGQGSVEVISSNSVVVVVDTVNREEVGLTTNYRRDENRNAQHSKRKPSWFGQLLVLGWCL